MNGPQVRAHRTPYSDSVSLLVLSESGGKRFVADPLVIREYDEGDDLSYRPTIRLSNDDAQLLMDELWQCGLRPSEGTGSAGSLKATQDHLKDMREIAFSVIRNNNPTG